MNNQYASAQSTARPLDMAKGILIGLRRCEPDAAFVELVAVARRYQIPLFSMADALIAVATGDTETHSDKAAAQLAARREWYYLLAGRDHEHRG